MTNSLLFSIDKLQEAKGQKEKKLKIKRNLRNILNAVCEPCLDLD